MLTFSVLLPPKFFSKLLQWLITRSTTDGPTNHLRVSVSFI